MTKKVQLVELNKNNRARVLYLISEDEIQPNNLCMFCVNDKLVEGYPDDLLGNDIQWVKKIVALPCQIGLIYSGYKTQKRGETLIDVSEEQIQKILDNNGECEIEMEINNNAVILPDTVDLKHFELWKPKFFENKVIFKL